MNSFILKSGHHFLKNNKVKVVKKERGPNESISWPGTSWKNINGRKSIVSYNFNFLFQDSCMRLYTRSADVRMNIKNTDRG